MKLIGKPNPEYITEKQRLLWDETTLLAIKWKAEALQKAIEFAKVGVCSSTAFDALGGFHDAISNGLVEIETAIAGEVS